MNQNYFWLNNTTSKIRRMNDINEMFDYKGEYYNILFSHKSQNLKTSSKQIINKASEILPHEKFLLIRAALDIWSGSGNLSFSAALKSWDSEYWIKFLKALISFLEIQDRLIKKLIDN